MQTLTIIMYHYVRDTERTAFPGIKALSIDEFRGQLDYLERHYVFVGLEEVFAALEGDWDSLPPNGVLLTFDDGYRDHYDTVFPMLRDRGISGIFFPPVMPVVERRVLDVNKIQFVLSQTGTIQELVDVINEAVRENQGRFDLDTPEEYWQRHAKASRFDKAEVIFVKHMLQHGLPRELRADLAASLFNAYVASDEEEFAEELYLSADQLRTMAAEGMRVGSHGNNHCWMDRLGTEEQRAEIASSLEFLKTLGVSGRNWIMCYPYGAYDGDLVRLVREMGCALGVTTVPAVARLGEDDRFSLPRLDTNDLPKAMLPMNEFTRQVLPPTATG